MDVFSIRIAGTWKRAARAWRKWRHSTRIPSQALCCLLLVPALLAGCESAPSRIVFYGPARAARPTASVGFTRETSEWISNLRHPILDPLPIDPDDGFNPDEIALIAVASNPALRALRDNRGIAHAQVISAGLLPNPTVSFQPYIPVDGKTSGNVTGYSGQLSWSISQLFSREPRTTSAKFAEERVKLDIAWSEWNVAMKAQFLAYQIILLRQAREIHTANISELTDDLSHIRHSASVGGVTTAQLANTEAVLLRAQTANAMTKRDIALRIAELRGVLGGLEGIADHLTGDLQIPENLADFSSESLANDLAGRRPDLKALRMATRSQNAAYRAATKKAFPSIQLGLQLARDPGDFLAIGPTIQIGFPVLNHGQADRAMVRAQSMRIADLYQERLNQARQNIAMAAAQIRGSADALSYMDEAIVQQQNVVELYGAARNRGATNIIVYYTARTTLVQLRLQRTLERTRLWQGLIQLRLESGLYPLAGGPVRAQGGPDAR